MLKYKKSHKIKLYEKRMKKNFRKIATAVLVSLFTLSLSLFLLSACSPSTPGPESVTDYVFYLDNEVYHTIKKSDVIEEKLPVAPTLEVGYDFVGWYKEKTFKNKIEESDILSWDKTEGKKAYGRVEAIYKVRETDNALRGLTPYGVAEYDGEELVIPSTLYGVEIKNIGMQAFLQNPTLKNIVLPSTVTEIKDGAFQGCSKLESISLPQGLKSIGREVFNGCTALKSVSLPSSLEVLDSYSFKDCSSLTTVTIPTNIALEKIGTSAFENCVKLSGISLSEGIKEIGVTAFRGCIELQSISLPNSLTVLGADCLLGCDKLTYFNENGLNYMGNNTNKYVYLAGVSNKSITTLNIASTCKFIGKKACEGLTEITSINIPASVLNVAENAFKDCSNATDVHFDLESKATFIGEGAFNGCSKIERMTIPFVGIGESAVYQQQRTFGIIFGVENILRTYDNTRVIDGVTYYLQYETYPNNFYHPIPTTLKYINVLGGYIQDFAFRNVNQVTTYVIGKNVTGVGHNTFRDVASSLVVYYEGTESDWSELLKNMHSNNTASLKNAPRYYYSATNPGASGYWHYVNGIATKW